jgi:hypothetical protein
MSALLDTHWLLQSAPRTKRGPIALPTASYQDEPGNRERISAEKEAAAVTSPMDSSYGGLQIPHDLFDVKGLGIVDKMMSDETVGAFIQMKKSAALSVDPYIEPAMADDPRQVEIADQTWEAIDNVNGSLIEAMEDMYSAIEYGYSVTNVVLTYMEHGNWSGKVGLKYLKTKPPESVRFDTDEYLNIKDDGILFTSGFGDIERLPREEFAIYTYRKRFSNPYGYGDCIRAYDRWNSKTWINKFWDIYLERTATGTLIAKYKHDNRPPKSEHDVVQKFLQNKQVRSAIKISDLWELEQLETTGRGSDVFENSINHRNTVIARSLLLPDLLGFSEKSGGAYALGKKHFDVFLWILLRLHKDISEVMEEQVIRRLVDLNWGKQPSYPKFRFKSLTDDQKILWLTNVFTGIEKGAITPDLEIENAIRRQLDIAEKEEQEQDRGGGSAPAPKPEPGGDDSDAGDGAFSFQLTASTIKPRREPTKYERKVDVDGIANFMNEMHDGFAEIWTDLFGVWQKSTIEFLRKKKIVALRDTKAVSDLKIPRIVDMRNSLAVYSVASVYYGALQAQREIDLARKQKYERAEHFRIALDQMKLDEVEASFIQRGLVLSTLIKAAAAEAKRESFFITGVESEKVLNQARMIIFRGIRRGDQVWVEGELRKLFDGYLSTGELTDRALGQAWRIETIARNNFATAFNQGRRAYLRDPDVDDYVEAYQWSSILDDGTTEYCMKMDGRILRKSELDSIGWPPAHHGCRSFPTPIVKGEEFKFDSVPAGISRGEGFAICCEAAA